MAICTPNVSSELRNAYRAINNRYEKSLSKKVNFFLLLKMVNVDKTIAFNKREFYTNI